MGFGVNCEGADLFRRLRRDEDVVLGRRFALYIVALATEVDDHALAWLIEYGRAIDSLTGDAIAFIVFCNSIRFQANTHGGGFDDVPFSVDPEGTSGVFRRPIPEIRVPALAMTDSRTITAYIKGHTHFPKEAFVTSMTYESDSAARYLGIRASELPCLVLIDDPTASEYEMVPLESESSDMMANLRLVVGEFYTDPRTEAYVDLLSEWDLIERELRERKLAIENMRAASADIVESYQRAVVLADQIFGSSTNDRFDAEPRIAVERLRKATSKLRGIGSPALESELLRLSGVVNDLARIERTRRASQYFLPLLAAHSLSDQDKISLHRLFKRTLRHLLAVDALGGKHWTALDEDDWARLLRRAVSAENPPYARVLTEFARARGAVSEALQRYDPRDVAASIDEQAVVIEVLEGRVEEIRLAAEGLDRPRVGPIMRRIKWGERRRMAATAARGAVKGIRSEIVLRAVEIGLQSRAGGL